jgi:hypothetical protein
LISFSGESFFTSKTYSSFSCTDGDGEIASIFFSSVENDGGGNTNNSHLSSLLLIRIFLSSIALPKNDFFARFFSAFYKKFQVIIFFSYIRLEVKKLFFLCECRKKYLNK